MISKHDHLSLREKIFKSFFFFLPILPIKNHSSRFTVHPLGSKNKHELRSAGQPRKTKAYKNIFHKKSEGTNTQREINMHHLFYSLHYL